MRDDVRVLKRVGFSVLRRPGFFVGDRFRHFSRARGLKETSNGFTEATCAARASSASKTFRPRESNFVRANHTATPRAAKQRSGQTTEARPDGRVALQRRARPEKTNGTAMRPSRRSFV